MYAIKITAFLFHSMCIFLMSKNLFGCSDCQSTQITKCCTSKHVYIGPIWAIYVGLPRWAHRTAVLGICLTIFKDQAQSCMSTYNLLLFQRWEKGWDSKSKHHKVWSEVIQVRGSPDLEQSSKQLAGGRVIPAVPRAAPEMGWSWMWMPSVLCLVLFFAFCFRFALLCFASLCCYLLFAFYDKCYLSQCMGFPTVGYVRPAKP